MIFFNKKKDIFSNSNNDYLFLLLFILYSFIGSVYQGLYIYDGFHWGLVLANSNDFLDGKLPYKDFFVHYGFLTLLIHSLVIKVFHNVIYLIVAAAISYISAIIIIFLIIKKVTNSNYSLLFLLTIFFYQPFAVYPWHTYFLFFFIACSILFYFKKKNIFNFFFSFSLSLCFLASETFKICGIAIFFFSLIFLLFSKREFKNILQNIFFLFLGAFVPLFVFFCYLWKYSLITYWIEHNDISNIFLKILDADIITLIFAFIKNYIKNVFFSFNEPYFIFGLVLNFFLIYYIFNSFFKKKKNFYLLFLSIYSLLLNYTLVFKHENFRFFSGPIIGIVVVFYFLNRINKSFIKSYILLFYIFLMALNNPFEKNNSNLNFTLTTTKNKSTTNDKLEIFRYMRFENDTWEHLHGLENLLLQTKKECPYVINFANLTTDNYYYVIMSRYFKTEQFYPSYSNTIMSTFYDGLLVYFRKSFFNYININTHEQNLILIKDKTFANNLIIQNNNIFLNDYSAIDLNYSYLNKEKVLLVPSKCFNKINN